MKQKVHITLPDNHPQSKKSISQIACDCCRSRAEEALKHCTLHCPQCLGQNPEGSIYCAWCAQKISLMLN
jgi:hypothetical protein